jgi:hypothetical protein
VWHELWWHFCEILRGLLEMPDTGERAIRLLQQYQRNTYLKKKTKTVSQKVPFSTSVSQ